MASAPSTTPLRQQQQEQSYGDDPDRDNTETDSLSSETDSLSSETDSLSSETDSLGSEVIPDAPAHTHEAHGKSVYHGIKVRFQEGVVSRLDGARLDALVEVGEHKGTKDVVVAYAGRRLLPPGGNSEAVKAIGLEFLELSYWHTMLYAETISMAFHIWEFTVPSMQQDHHVMVIAIHYLLVNKTAKEP
ncbi:hypothetical protein HO173_003234 [Letharia columbiana]|uniref:Uncharacterized protein n=1 Tax=Letharia columbiana TaxID=112416 RepID=A0A8H6G1D4_9LECA|nr:uncharacterized protein HO173_003234 [Letharia columbiana]KAF6238728.1 hypothetical protein HO173_003234 [Letharia columbiana]